jgi:hypothetical protein
VFGTLGRMEDKRYIRSPLEAAASQDRWDCPAVSMSAPLWGKRVLTAWTRVARETAAGVCAMDQGTPVTTVALECVRRRTMARLDRSVIADLQHEYEASEGRSTRPARRNHLGFAAIGHYGKSSRFRCPAVLLREFRVITRESSSNGVPAALQW